MHQEVLNLNLIAENFIKMIRRVIGEHIEFCWNPCIDLKSVFADAGMIEQVLLNLSLNARDAMPDGGKLTIETSNVILDSSYCETHVWATPGPYVLLCVSDTGIGMNKEILARLYEPFFTTKDRDKGTGLGLAMVYGIMKQHNGIIDVYSEPDNGTTFKAYFPATDKVPETQKPISEVENRATYGSETILLAEDNDMVQKLEERI